MTVDCTAAAPPPGVFNSITAALFTLDNVGPHAVTVTGPCTEAVNIQQRDRLTIQSAPPHTAVISAPAPGVTVLTVGGSHNITLRGLVLRGGGNGLLVTRGSTVMAQGVSMTENAGNGLRLDTGHGVFLDFNGALAMNGAVVTNNTGGGVRVARSSVGDFGLGNTFAGNGGAQISCDDTSLISGPGLAGLPNKAIACKNIEHAQGPPRPNVPKEQDE